MGDAKSARVEVRELLGPLLPNDIDRVAHFRLSVDSGAGLRPGAVALNAVPRSRDAVLRSSRASARPQHQLARTVRTFAAKRIRAAPTEGAFIAADVGHAIWLQRSAAAFALPSHLEPEEFLQHPVEIRQLGHQLESAIRRKPYQARRAKAEKVFMNRRLGEAELLANAPHGRGSACKAPQNAQAGPVTQGPVDANQLPIRSRQLLLEPSRVAEQLGLLVIEHERPWTMDERWYQKRAVDTGLGAVDQFSGQAFDHSPGIAGIREE